MPEGGGTMANSASKRKTAPAWLVPLFFGALAVALLWLVLFHSVHVAYLIGASLLYVLWALYALVAGDANPAMLTDGADSRPSTSKLQWLLWTIVALFAYAVVGSARFVHGGGLPTMFPRALLSAMGLSLGTMAAAKGITVAYAANGKVIKTDAATAAALGSRTARGLSALIKDDDGTPDLSKAQMLAWTVVAIGFFLWQLTQQVAGRMPELPDIDPTLVVLMGLGQGAYLGKKLVTTDTPRLTGIDPAAGPPGTVITLTGLAFGNDQAGGYVTLSRMPAQGKPLEWKDDHVKFTFPITAPDGSKWIEGQPVEVSLTAGGDDAANSLRFTVTK